jgi:alpha-L-rhamnosidase
MQGAPQRLRCEYLESPRGIDVARPRLSWHLGDDRPAEVQTAYQILAASKPDLLEQGEGDLWDSGRVEGGESTQIEYGGKPLTSGRSVCWKVRSYDSDGLPSPWSQLAYFEAGLLTAEDWHGRWIGAGLEGSRVDGVPVPMVARRFELEAAPERARLYVAALGQVAVQINGTAIDDVNLSPDWVDYTRRTGYLTLDVGDRLRAGSNDIAVLLADGWYAGSPGGRYRQQYGTRPWLNVQLNAELESGKRVSVVSDSTWRWRPSWILAADPSRGESQDARQRRANWVGEGPESPGWYPVEVRRESAADALTFSPVAVGTARRAAAEATPCRRWDPELRAGLFDFEVSRVGRAAVELTAPAGGVIRLRYGLELDGEGGLISQGEDTFTAAGLESGERFEAEFSRHAFRYVEVSGDVFHEDAIAVRQVGIAKPLSIVATLVSDHSGLNELHHALIRHMAMVQQTVPFKGLDVTDQLGAVGDFGHSVNALLSHFEGASRVVDWLTNMADAQYADGGFPRVVPAPPGEESLAAEGEPGSSESFAEALWHLYRHTGDRRRLREAYPRVRLLLHGAVDRANGFIREDLEQDGEGPSDLAGTAWLFRLARLSARIAGVLGNLSELEDCEELAAKVRNAFRRRFVTLDGRLVSDSVEAYALAMGFGLLDPVDLTNARRRLFGACEAALAGGAVSNDLLAVPFLLRVLTDHGRLDLAYRLVLQSRGFAGSEVDPGPLVRAGVADWLLETLSGFRPGRDLSERQNAFRHMIIQPRPPIGLGFQDAPLRAAEAVRVTSHGRYESTWRITDDAFETTVRIPGNCTGEVVLPDGSRHDVVAGVHTFRMPFGEAGDGIPVLREVS